LINVQLSVVNFGCAFGAASQEKELREAPPPMTTDHRTLINEHFFPSARAVQSRSNLLCFRARKRPTSRTLTQLFS
jgi:hypothetical protein